jgi:hypothetical protein
MAAPKEAFDEKPWLIEEEGLQIGLSSVIAQPEGITDRQRAGEARHALNDSYQRMRDATNSDYPTEREQDGTGTALRHALSSMRGRTDQTSNSAPAMALISRNCCSDIWLPNMPIVPPAA